MLFRWARQRAPATLATALALASVGCGGDDTTASSTTATTTSAAAASTTGATPVTTTPAAPTTVAGRLIDVVVRAGSVEGGGRQKVSLNELVRLRVTSDVADEVHVHGYDRRAAVAAGATAEVSFVADLPGVFEVELENSKKRLLSLEVQP